MSPSGIFKISSGKEDFEKIFLPFGIPFSGLVVRGCADQQHDNIMSSKLDILGKWITNLHWKKVVFVFGDVSFKFVTSFHIVTSLDSFCRRAIF